jgi:hypothetical protein
MGQTSVCERAVTHNEQKLFGLMAMAQEQQKVVNVAVQRPGDRQVELEVLLAVSYHPRAG